MVFEKVQSPCPQSLPVGPSLSWLWGPFSPPSNLCWCPCQALFGTPVCARAQLLPRGPLPTWLSPHSCIHNPVVHGGVLIGPARSTSPNPSTPSLRQPQLQTTPEILFPQSTGRAASSKLLQHCPQTIPWAEAYLCSQTETSRM